MPSRFRRLFLTRFTRADPSEVEREFEFHLAMRTRELEALGHSPDAAGKLALEQFGDVDDARQYCREEDEGRMDTYRRSLWLDALRQDVRFALRALRRTPAFAVASVLTLGSAIALCVIAYAIMHVYLVRPLPYPNSDRLVYVRFAPGSQPNPAALAKVDWRAVNNLFDRTLWWNLDAFTAMTADRTEALRGAWVPPSYFTTLGFRPQRGRLFTADEHENGAPVAMISDRMWARLFNRDPALIGGTLRLQSAESTQPAELVTIVGVMPAEAWHVNAFTDVLRPMSARPSHPYMALLPAGADRNAIEARLNQVVANAGSESTPAFALESVHRDYTNRVRPTLLALLGAAAFLLLVAAASVAGAQAARAAARRGELRVRAALGASLRRITGQLVVESTVTALLAGMIAVAIALPTLAALAPTVGVRLGTSLPDGSGQLNPGVGIIIAVVFACSVLGAIGGLVPALLIGRAAAGGEGLTNERGTARGRVLPGFRRGLIIAQISVTMMLLVGAGLMARTVMAIAVTPLGFDERGVAKGDLFLPQGRYPNPAAWTDAITRALSVARDAGGITEVAAAFPDPFRTFIVQPSAIVADAGPARGDSSVLAAPFIVSPGYFDVMRVSIRQGRGLTEEDRLGSQPVVVVSEELARRLWPGETGVGRRIRWAGDSVWRTVVGIAGEALQPAESRPIGETYVPYRQQATPLISLLARGPLGAPETATALERAIRRFDAQLALASLGPLEDVGGRATSRHRTLAGALAILSALALGLVSLALYASLAYMVAQRRREIAIRAALGASEWSVRRLVAGEGLALATAGVVIGSLMSFAAARVLASQLYRVTPTDPLTFAAIALIVAVCALAAAVIPTRSAARVPPADTLRAE